jgi:hypothetical protein
MTCNKYLMGLRGVLGILSSWKLLYLLAGIFGSLEMEGFLMGRSQPLQGGRLALSMISPCRSTESRLNSRRLCCLGLVPCPKSGIFCTVFLV